MELTDKMWYASVTMNSTGVEVEQHEGLWHPVERRIVQDEIFILCSIMSMETPSMELWWTRMAR